MQLGRECNHYLSTITLAGAALLVNTVDTAKSLASLKVRVHCISLRAPVHQAGTEVPVQCISPGARARSSK